MTCTRLKGDEIRALRVLRTLSIFIRKKIKKRMYLFQLTVFYTRYMRNARKMINTYMKTNINIADQIYGLDELVDHKIASKIIGLSPRTVQNLGCSRKLITYKVGSRANRYLVRDLLAWCEQRRMSNAV